MRAVRKFRFKRNLEINKTNLEINKTNIHIINNTHRNNEKTINNP